MTLLLAHSDAVSFENQVLRLLDALEVLGVLLVLDCLEVCLREVLEFFHQYRLLTWRVVQPR